MKKTDVTQPVAMATPFAEGVYSATSTEDFEIPAATSTTADDSCVMDNGFLPITSTALDDGGKAPERKNFNGMFYLSTDQRFFLQNGGFITYNPDVATAIGGYPQDAILDFIDSNGNYKKVRSLIDDNSNNFIADETLIDGTNWEEIQMGGGASRNIGEIVASAVPLTDAGLHLFDGALIQGLGVYSAFVTYIAGLRTDYPDLFTTEALWQQAVTTYGVCGKFVYDSINNTVRLPKITGIVEGTTDVTALGDLIEAGLPVMTTSTIGNHSHATNRSTSNDDGGVFFTSGNSQTHNDLTTQGAGEHSHTVTWGATTNTVQPQSIKVLYYIVVATSTKTEIEINIDEIATDLNGKADVDLTNVTNVGNIKMAKASMPSSRKIQLTTGASGAAYIAPADGYLFASCTLAQSGFIIVSNDTFHGYETAVIGPVGGASEWVPIRKGATGHVQYLNASDVTVWFIYAVGSESEAN